MKGKKIQRGGDGCVQSPSPLWSQGLKAEIDATKIFEENFITHTHHGICPRRLTLLSHIYFIFGRIVCCVCKLETFYLNIEFAPSRAFKIVAETREENYKRLGLCKIRKGVSRSRCFYLLLDILTETSACRQF